MSRKVRRPKVIHKRIIRRKGLYGIYDDELNKIFLDPRYSHYEQFKTLIHELIHVALPDLKEREVVRVTNKIFPVIWRQGYRRVMGV